MKSISRYRDFSLNRKNEFIENGYRERYFFPHQIYYLPKCGPDGLKISQRLLRERDPNKSWEVVLYADKSLTEEFPHELFFDDDVMWHQQQFGKKGQVATANMIVNGNEIYGYNYLSDLVQRISRRKEFRSRIENRFRGWPHMLLNGILNFAVEKKLRYFFSPTADLVYERNIRIRAVKRDLFDRVYDRAVLKNFHAERQGKWWIIDVAQNKNKLIVPEQKEEVISKEKTISICHDIERGLGHLGIDSRLVASANKTAPKYLDQMLAIEGEMEVNATYNVVGSFLNEVRPKIEANGHCIAFHSYDHIVPGKDALGKLSQKFQGILRKNGIKLYNKKLDQLSRCRKIDYRVKGYRPPRSLITTELTDSYLCFQNFEWLASSRNSLKVIEPQLQNRIVKIPVSIGDFKLYKHGVKYIDWQKEVLELIEQNDFIAICLHDCYAQHWLPHYRAFLEKIRGLGHFETFNEVAAHFFLSNST